MLMHVELAQIKLGRGDLDVAQQMEIISSEILRLRSRGERRSSTSLRHGRN
jgi:hypothetical protein